MDRHAELVADLKALGSKLAVAVVSLDDPESRVGGSDVASIARERRMLGQLIARIDPVFDLAGVLVADFEVLGEAIGMTSGAGVAAVVRERRIASELVAALAAPEGVAKVDELASFRAARAAVAGAPRRRRKSG